MVNSYTLYRFLIVLLLSGFLLASCSSFKKYDNVVRIKPEYATKWENFEGPNGKVIRNGNALRGTVINITKEVQVNCETKDTTIKYFIYFLDSLAESDMRYMEKIPLEEAILVGQITPNLPMNEHQNINFFEYYSNPLDEKNLREVPIETYQEECTPCNCQKFTADYKITPPKFKCPDCDYNWYFLELRYGYGIYNDVRYNNQVIGRSGQLAEIAYGYRSPDNWGVGLAFNYGLKAYDQFDTNRTDITRSFLLLHGRYSFAPPKTSGDYDLPFLKPIYDFAEATCTRPFVYAQYGIGLDSLTMDLMRVKLCKDCENKISYKPGNLDLTFPTSYAIGVGIELPLPFCLFDLAIDLSYRSYDIADRINTGEFWNVPSRRTLNIFLLRFGITF